jgi:hypothetical protein
MASIPPPPPPAPWTFALPPGFPTLLKDFAREVLRHQPPDIHAFGAEYFTGLALRLAEGEGRPPDHRRRPPPSPADRSALGDLRDVLLDALAEEDLDQTARLPADVIKRALTAAVPLSAEHALFVIASAGALLDPADGTIHYESLVEETLPYLYHFLETKHVFPRGPEVVYGLPGTDLFGELNGFLQQAADLSETGRLPLKDLYTYLTQGPVPLTPSDAAFLTAEAFVDEDGLVSASDEAARAVPLLRAAAAFDAFRRDYANGPS